MVQTNKIAPATDRLVSMEQTRVLARISVWEISEQKTNISVHHYVLFPWKQLTTVTPTEQLGTQKMAQ